MGDFDLSNIRAEAKAEPHCTASMRLANGTIASVSAVGAEIVVNCHNESTGVLVPFRMDEKDADDFVALVRTATNRAAIVRRTEGLNR